ncbi:MAG TPA: GNAT family N-acetyltransferase [Pyrinomonadaceae bacterium]|nr:GNAT family N-acetyltransferase [Pyrinomonadaceae bacterium]
MNSGDTITTTVSKDAELISELGRETFYDAFAHHSLIPRSDMISYLDKAFSVRQIRTEIDDPNAVFLLAKMAGEPAGYAKLEFDNRVTGLIAERPVKLKRLYSKHKFIGRGIGATLMHTCLEKAGHRGHDVIWLTVWENNFFAQDFYKRWNYEPAGSIDFHFGQTILRDVLMQRPVILENSDEITEKSLSIRKLGA